MTSILPPLIGISLAAWLFYNSGLFPRAEEKVCDTPACNNFSTIIRESMDTSVEPCDDFHKFACGKHTFYPESPSIYEKFGPTGPHFSTLVEYLLRDALASEESPDDILPVKQMKKIYKSCMNFEARESEGFQRILDEFKKMGGWNSNLTWQEIDRHYADLIGLNAFYNLQIENNSLRINDPLPVDVNYNKERRKLALANLTQLMNAELSSDELNALVELQQEMRRDLCESPNYLTFQNTAAFLEWWKKRIDGISKQNLSFVNIDWMDIFQRYSQEMNFTLLNDTSILYEIDQVAEIFLHLNASSERSKAMGNSSGCPISSIYRFTLAFVKPLLFEMSSYLRQLRWVF